MDPKALRTAALAYAARGWRVIALHNPITIAGTDQIACSCFRRGECRTPGKHPRFAQWRQVATTDPDKIRTWWQHCPRSNVGIATGGLAGLVVVDIDGQEGRDSLAKLVAEHGELPETLRQSTGRAEGGTHHVFQVEVGYLDWFRNRAKIAPGIDIRAEGGLIVAAPSLHPSGAVYAWENDGAPVAPLPPWIGKLTRSEKSRQATFSANGTRPDEAAIEAVWPLSQRLKLARAALLRADPAIQGADGSRACLKAAITVVRGYLVPTEGGVACDLLSEVYNPRCRPPWTEYELVHKVNSASVSVDVPWGYRLSAVVDPEEWDLRPGAVQTPRQLLLAAMAKPAVPAPAPEVTAPAPETFLVPAPVSAPTFTPASDVIAATIKPDFEPAPRARLPRPVLPAPAVELLWAPYPLHQPAPVQPVGGVSDDDDDHDECA